MSEPRPADAARGPGPSPATLYDLLGVAVGASRAEIRSRYRALVKRFHPDAGGTTSGAAQLIEINHAWAILGDPRRRAVYDSEVLGISDRHGEPLLTSEDIEGLRRARMDRWRKVAAAGFQHFFPAPPDWLGRQTLWEARSYGWWEHELRRLPRASAFLLRLDAPPGARYEALGHLERDELVLLRSAPMYDALDERKLAHLSGQVALADLQLPHMRVTDAGIAAMGPLPQLRVLNLFGNRLTNACLAVIGACPELIELNLGGNPIDDLSPILGLKRLRRLDLRKTGVDEHGLLALRGLDALEQLDVAVGWRARRRLRDALPGVEVV